MKIIRFEDAIVTEWSGGKTHEILIRPELSDFKSGDYDLRLSVATVNIEETTFTSLPGVNRILTVLEGNLTLNHEDHHRCQLGPYQQDRFQGDWTTKSKGKVRDFNVMWKRGEASVKSILLEETIDTTIEARHNVSLLFVVSGIVQIGEVNLVQNDAILFEKNLILKTTEETNVLLVDYKN